MPEVGGSVESQKGKQRRVNPDSLHAAKTELFPETLVINSEGSKKNAPANINQEKTTASGSGGETVVYDTTPTLQEMRIRDLIRDRWDKKEVLTEAELVIEDGKLTTLPSSLHINGQEFLIDNSDPKSGGMGSVFSAEPVYSSLGSHKHRGKYSPGTIAHSGIIDYPFPQRPEDKNHPHRAYDEVLLKYIPVNNPRLSSSESRIKAMVTNEAIRLYKEGQLKGVKLVETAKGEQMYVLAMEKIKGQTLDAYRKETTPSPERSLTLMLAMKAYVKQLQTLDAESIMHRDIKPANLMIHPTHPEELSGIIDFGVAVTKTQAEQERGFITGTPLYLSPDATMGLPKNRDMYGLGLSLAEALGLMKLNYNSEDNAFSIIKRIQDKKFILSPQLEDQTYHSLLKEQYPYAPERDFAMLLYYMVQPNIAPGKYDFTHFPNGFASVLSQLEDIIRRQRLIVRARYVLEQIDFYQQQHHQFVRKGGMSMFRQLLQTALDKQNFVGIEKALQKIQRYLQLDPRERIVKLERQIEDKDQYNSLEHNMIVHIDNLAQHTEKDGTVTVPADYIQQLRNHVMKARVYSRSGDFDTATRYLEHLRAVIQTVEMRRSRHTDASLPLPSLDEAEFMQAVLEKKSGGVRGKSKPKQPLQQTKK